MRFSSSSAIPSRVIARLSGVPFTRISLFCREITTERRLGSLACGFSGVSGVPPIVSTSRCNQPSGRTVSPMRSTERIQLMLSCLLLLCGYYLFPFLVLFILYYFIFFRFFLAFSGSTPSALRNHSSAFFRSPSR